MRSFARILSVLAIAGLFLSGCDDGGVGELGQLANQVPPGDAGHGGTSAPVTGGTSGGASGTGAAAGMSGGAAGMSAGVGGMNAAGAGGSGGAGTSAAGEGGTSGDAASGTGGASGDGASGEGGAGGAGGMTPPPPPPEYLPAADNPPECPATAPEDPVGDCAGLPIYVVCNYGDDNYWYTCTCDWYHWLCAGT